MKLTATQCKNAKPRWNDEKQKFMTTRLGDGGGLHLVMTPAKRGQSIHGGKSWIQRIFYAGKRIDVGLGNYEIVSLTEARAKSLSVRKGVLDGIDPRRPKKGMTFEEAAKEVIAERRPGLTPKVAQSWQRSMELHVYPLIGSMAVGAVDMPDIRRVLMPLNGTSSLLGNVARRISAVLQWAIVMRHRTLAEEVQIVVDSLPRVKQCERRSHASIHHSDVSAAVAAVHATKVLPATKCAFAFLTLTASRSAEILGARWSEVDLEKATWTIPAERMKTRKVHRVPLSKQAIAVLKAAKTLSKGDHVFQGLSGQLAERAIRNALASAGIESTGHGFRTSFSDWCRETGVQSDVRERSLAHVESNKVQASYTVSDLLDQRREVMQTWADYIMP